jgi:pimeloyl-ACP methyl ester carboxylesterase
MNAIIVRNSGGEDEAASGVDAWGRLAEVTIPATVACGSLDAAYLIEQSKELATRLPNGRYVELPGVAHQPYLEQPGAVADLISSALA